MQFFICSGLWLFGDASLAHGLVEIVMARKIKCLR